VSGDYTINPVTAKDIQEYLAALAEFFPREGVLMAGTAEALNPEAAAKAFVAVNLTRRRETAEVAELVVTYQTTWGELFVRTVRPKEQPPYDPRALVSEVSGLDCSPGLEVRWFKPSRSACPAPFGPEKT
jgi:adenylate cyclase class 1